MWRLLECPWDIQIRVSKLESTARMGTLRFNKQSQINKASYWRYWHWKQNTAWNWSHYKKLRRDQEKLWRVSEIKGRDDHKGKIRQNKRRCVKRKVCSFNKFLADRPPGPSCDDRTDSRCDEVNNKAKHARLKNKRNEILYAHQKDPCVLDCLSQLSNTLYACLTTQELNCGQGQETHGQITMAYQSCMHGRERAPPYNGEIFSKK